MKKKILIDLSAYNNKLGGFTRVSLDLLSIVNTINDFDFYVLCHKSFENEFKKYAGVKIIARHYPVSARFFVNSFLIPQIVRDYKIDAVHFEINFCYFCPVPFSISIHDLYFLNKKQDVVKFSLKSKIMSLYWNLLFSRNITKASLIRAISKATKDELKAFVSDDKVRCIYNYVTVKENYKEEKKLSDPIKILFIGNQVPRKNLPFLLEVLDFVKRQFELHIIGTSYNVNDQLLAKYTYPIKQYGFLPENDKIEVLKNMDLLIIPSKKEGFSLPIFEAYEQNVLSWGADNSALKEMLPPVCLFPIDNINTLASMIDKLDSSSYNLSMNHMQERMARIKAIDYRVEYISFFNRLVSFSK